MATNAVEYTYAASGNVLARSAQIRGPRFIVNKGNSLVESGAEVRGDFHNNNNDPVINWGRYSCFGKDCYIAPPERNRKYHLCTIGSYVSIGSRTRVEAASIGSYVIIGENCTIGKFTIIKDCVVIAPGTTIPAYAVVAPLTVVHGPGLMDQEPAHESVQPFAMEYCRDLHAGRIPKPIPYLTSDNSLPKVSFYSSSDGTDNSYVTN